MSPVTAPVLTVPTKARTRASLRENVTVIFPGVDKCTGIVLEFSQTAIVTRSGGSRLPWTISLCRDAAGSCLLIQPIRQSRGMNDTQTVGLAMVAFSWIIFGYGFYLSSANQYGAETFLVLAFVMLTATVLWLLKR